jgi:uncharacterized repeat protein (TIGR01451 family)/fimbrial isopeptide formation D2 family protein
MLPCHFKSEFRSALSKGLLFALILLLGAVSTVQAGDFCSSAPYYGVVDGDVLGTAPTQVTIDTDCTFQNWPQSNPLTTTINFQTNDPTQYLIVFDQSYFTGHMACANVDHKIWFANSSDYGSGNACQDLFIPVETIDKQNPAGRTMASVGVPFTYRLTLPSMNWPVGDPSNNDLHSIVLTDDLTATGADLTYLGNSAYIVDGGTTTSLGALTLSATSDSKHLEFSYRDNPALALISAGSQIVVELTVVLDDTAANTAGKQFVNTAKWSFGRAIDVDDSGVIDPDEFFEPLPGEWGISQPMTIGEPDLVVTKTSSETALNLGVPATFSIDVQNVGGGDAWNATILDRLPDIPGTTGMCPATAPAISAEIFEADGTSVTGPLSAGDDYTVSYDAGACELSLAMSDTSAAKIGPSQHLIVTYDAELDTDTDPSAEGITLTNVAGATRWYSGDSSHADRRSYGGGPGALTDGTPTVLDFQDSATVTTALSGYYFQKTVADLTSGMDPATTAASGDRLRYQLRLFNVDETIDGISIDDLLDASRFDLNSFSMEVLPAAAAYSFDASSGLLEITGNGAPLNVAVGEELVVEFEITLKPTLANGTQVDNQATLSANGDTLNAYSDDPYVNSIAPPGEPADKTTVMIRSPGPLAKETTQASATIGDQFTYRITVPASPVDVPLYDVRILDDLSLSEADLSFISANVISGGSWSLTNTGTETDLVIEDTATGIDIPANGQAVIEVTVQLQNTLTNDRGLSFGNSASFTYNRMNGNDATQTSGSGSSAGSMTVVEPDLVAIKTVNFVTPAGKQATDPAAVGDVLEYVVTLTNEGDSTAFDTSIVDTLPTDLSLVADSATARINGVDVSGFVATPIDLGGGAVAWGQQNGDLNLDIPAGQSLVLTYRVSVDSISGANIENSAYVDWTSLDGASADERTGGACPVSDPLNYYCFGPAIASVSTLDNTSIAKAAVADSYAETPASTADPIVRVGDTVTYELTLNLREYVTRNVVVEDTLPAGMALESFTISSGASFSYSLAAQPAAGDTGTLRWEFGDISNQPSGDGTPIDALVIQYVAKVVTDAPTAGVAYDTSITRDNQTQLSYTGGDPATDPDRLTATETIEVRQPQMGAVTKVDLGSGRTGSGTMADPYQVNIADDVMRFQLSSCNEGLAPAYGVVMTDRLAPQLDETDLTTNPPVVRIGGTTLIEGSDYVLTLPGRGGELRIVLQDSAPVNPGECVTVDYSIGFHNDLTTSTTWSNQASLPEYRSLPLAESGRIYTASDTAQVWMTNLVSVEQLLKTLVSSEQATIGDEVVYRITVPAAPMNTAIDNALVTDALPDTLEYVGATAVNGDDAPVPLSDTSVAPGQVNLGIAHIPAGEQVIITLTARVANNDQANAGDSFTNTASYTYTDMPDGLNTASTSGPVTIVEPELAIAKTVTNVSHPGAAPNVGDILRYSLSFTAGGGEAGDDYSDAFDLQVEDSLSLGMAYQGGSATVDGTGNSIADPAVTGDGTSAAQTLTWSPADAGADIDVPEGTQVTVTYDVEVLSGVQPGRDLTNSATVQWTGQDGDNGFERTGTGTPVENDYFTGPATSSLRTELAVTVVKSVSNATTGQNPGDNAEPGDTLQYTLVLSNQSVVPLTNATLVDDLDPWFAAGSLQLVSVSDADADTTHIDTSGGANGTGLVDIRNLTLAARGEPGDTVTVVFTATLAAVINNCTTILNQAQLNGDELTEAASNQTSTLIGSAPAFEVWKTSEDITGDPQDLVAGDTLRYTITVKNVGNENAVDAQLQDQIPTYTSYVAGSTRLNGHLVPDPAAGVSALQSGMPINAPEDATPGAMRADASAGTDNVATITFDVTINDGVVDGAIISNQGFLDADGAGSGAMPQEPSDDPDTATLDDPTIDIVGKVPLVDALKTVRILIDNDGDGSVDPDDTLQYTITISNEGTAPATGVVFTDAVPANTTYVENSVYVNGQPAGQPDGGASPLIAGIDVSSSDLSLPAAGEGTLTPGETAVITFDVQVNAGVAPGTIISNQGRVSGNEMLDEPTDADGDDGNGDQPTEVVVGDVQQLSIVKQVSVVGGGAALPGSQLEYLIRVTNIGSEPATSVALRDDLSALGGQATYVVGSASLDGSPAGVGFDGPVLTADYAGALPARGAAELRFRVQVAPAAAIGTTLTNTAEVSWDGPASPATASVSIDVGGTPGTATLNGNVWHDANLNKLDDVSERQLENWSVELYRNGQLLATTQTDAAGAYRFSGLVPNDGTAEFYELVFRAAGAGSNTPSLGTADSVFTDGPQRISDITVASGSNLQNLNLPIWPNGTVYNSISRQPVAGASLVLTSAATGTALPGRCFDDPAQQGQVTAQDGFYKFDLNFSDAACPSGGSYVIDVTPPASGYMPAQSPPSQVIPPASDATTEPFSVPDCPGNGDDAVLATPEYCEATPYATAPPASVLPRTAGTLYQLHLVLDNASMPGHSQIFNNPIPLDPVLEGAVAITKTSSLINVTRGELVPYTITVNNVFGVPLYDISIVDRFPAGFKYMAGSARLNGEKVEPRINGRELFWDGLELQVNESFTLQLLLVVGAGVSEGEYVNRAQVLNTAMGTAASGEASATVEVIPDPDFDCTDVIGKVFDDRNLNGWQEAGEKGLPGARVVTARGLIATTDPYGRFHITCATVPDRDRGSNFILKLDERSLPTGYRLTTENPRVQRATRGKMLRFNFGATIHRVVRIDIADGVFEPGTTALRPQWQPKIGQLLEELWKSPSVLRLSYLADVEPEDLVDARLDALKNVIEEEWDFSAGDYRLDIETEVFWRRGGPPQR